MNTGVGPAPPISADDEVYARNRLTIMEEPLELTKDFPYPAKMRNSCQRIRVHTSAAVRAVAPRRIADFARFLWTGSLEGAQQRAFDYLLGVSTRTSVFTDDNVFITGGDNLPYAACEWLPVRRVLKDLAPGPSDVFVDLGSGKGRALLIAGRLPYRGVVGVELDEGLSQCAIRNLERARPRLRAQEVDSVVADVLEWPIPDDTSVVFMYNPFIGQTFRAAVALIFESYDRKPRTLHIVYVYPWEHDWLVSTGRVVVDNVRPQFWPTRRRWWQTGNVIVSYRVVGALKDGKSEPPLPRRLFQPRRRAMRRWSGCNGHRFAIHAPGWESVYHHS